MGERSTMRLGFIAERRPLPRVPSEVIPSRPAPGEDWSADDPALVDLVRSYVPEPLHDEALPRLQALGTAAPADVDPAARLADRHRPILHRRTPEGERVDTVEFHPAYGTLQALAREHQVFTLAWHPVGEAPRGPRVLGFALGYLYAQAESGYYCPACMTDGAAFVLSRHGPEALRERHLPRLTAAGVDGAEEGAMYLTEKGGGSDVGGGTATLARKDEDDSWRLTGEKWFASNCVADVALALARMPDGPEGTSGLGLFLVPRRLPDGTPNPGLRIERLKEKLGVTSMPTGEVLLDDAVADLVEPAPAGFKAMAEMVNLSRLYNAVASVAVARRAVREGARTGRERTSFGRPLREHPLFLATLTRLTVDVEGALAFTLETADVFDRWAAGDETAFPLLRALTPCAKAMTAKLAVEAASEGCELLGGNGYIEDYVTPRLLRDAQVLPIWEGTTNIQALDLLRAAARDRALEALVSRGRAALDEAADLEGAGSARARVEAGLERLLHDAKELAGEERAAQEAGALRLLAWAYHTLAGSLLLRLASRASNGARALQVADLYTALHLAEDPRAGARSLEALAASRDLRVAYPGA